MKKQNAKAMRVNEGRQEYQQFLVRKQEERDMKKQKSNYNDQPFLSSEKQKYMSEKTHTGNSQNYQQLQQNNIQEQYNERNPSDLSNKTTPSHSYQGNNDYSNNVPNSDIYKPQNQGSYNMNNRGNNQDNQPKGEGVSPYQGYEELANLDFNDPNFDYNKYDELMQQYSKAMMQKEEEKKKEENEMKPTMYENQNNEDISQRMQNLNLNSNQQMNEDERKRMEFLQKEEEMYKQYQQEMLKQNDSFIPRNAPSSNPGAYDQYSKDLGPQERGEYQNIYQENPYSLQRGQTPQGITPSNIQQQPNNFQNRGPSIEYGVNPMHNINQQNEGSNNNLEYRHNNNTFQQQEMIHQNYNPYQQGQNVHQNHHQSMNQGQGRSNSQNPNRNNAQSYLNDREKLVNNFQYNQMIYQKNKANNYFSNITHNQYNFEKVATGEQKQNVNQGNQNFNPYQGNSNGQIPNQIQSMNQQNEFNNSSRSKKYEQQMMYKNFLDSQVKERSNMKDNNYKVNEFTGLNRKDRNIQTNPYTSKNYEFGSTNLVGNIITPNLESRGQYIPQPNFYQERPVMINKQPQGPPQQINVQGGFNRPPSGKLQIVGTNLMNR